MHENTPYRRTPASFPPSLPGFLVRVLSLNCLRCSLVIALQTAEVDLILAIELLITLACFGTPAVLVCGDFGCAFADAAWMEPLLTLATLD